MIEEIYSLFHSVQTASEAHSASYPKGITGVPSSEVKRPGHEVNHSPPSSTEVHNARNHFPNTSSWHAP
jgi:hypothetical protein